MMVQRGPEDRAARRVHERLESWGVTPTGETWTTPTSRMAAGVLDGRPVVAKLALSEEERRGGRLMTWWGSQGGLPVLAHDEDHLLMARATGVRDLTAWSLGGKDDEAVEVLVQTVRSAHALPPPPAEVGLLPLRTWFRALVDAPQPDPLLDGARSIALDLLAEPEDGTALHGDVHHGNVLDLGDRWALIDPKGLLGHRAFDFANLFCNPGEEIAVERLHRRVDVVSDGAGLDPDLLQAWTVAWCGLSLVWHGDVPSWHARAARAVAAELLR